MLSSEALGHPIQPLGVQLDLPERCTSNRCSDKAQWNNICKRIALITWGKCVIPDSAASPPSRFTLRPKPARNPAVHFQSSSRIVLRSKAKRAPNCFDCPIWSGTCSVPNCKDCLLPAPGNPCLQSMVPKASVLTPAYSEKTSRSTGWKLKVRRSYQLSSWHCSAWRTQHACVHYGNVFAPRTKRAGTPDT